MFFAHRIINLIHLILEQRDLSTSDPLYQLRYQESVAKIQIAAAEIDQRMAELLKTR